MGIGAVPAQILREFQPNFPAAFSVCELGDQLYRAEGRRDPAEGFWRSLGCARYETIDANGHASVLADLNLPLPADVLERLGTFDVVTDFGTSEHVFDNAQCWRTMYALTKPGGFIVLESPHQGYLDHGLINIQPTRVKDIARANGMTVHVLRVDPMERGQLIRAILERKADAPWVTPTQGRYRKSLKL